MPLSALPIVGRPARTLVVLGALAATGCGKVPGQASAASGNPVVATVNGQTEVKFGFGKEGGERPAIVHTTAGWVAAYVGTNVGDRHLYTSTSADGSRWSAPQGLGKSDFSDQSPSFVIDAKGQLHLYFTSDRDGDDFKVFHSQQSNGSWSAPVAIDGTTGTDNVAAGLSNGKLILAEEVLGTGLALVTGSDATHFGQPEHLADAGFEPALTSLPDGRTLVVYMHDGALFGRVGKPGGFGDEQDVAAGSGKIHEPSLAWLGDHGVLAFAMHTDTGYVLQARRFDASAVFQKTALSLPTSDGEARAPGLAAGSQGSCGLIWGMKDSNGQQGVIFSIPTL